MPTPPMTADVDLYRAPAVFEAERAAIFARSWQFLGLEAEATAASERHLGAIPGLLQTEEYARQIHLDFQRAMLTER